MAALAPVSGAYDLGGTEPPALLDGWLDSKMSTVYTAYPAVTFQRLRGGLYDDPAEVFRTDYAGHVEQLFSGAATGREVMERTPGTVDELLTEEGRRRLSNSTGAFAAALTEAGAMCADWAPRVPTRLYVTSGDTEALPANTDWCRDGLRAAGARPRVIDLGPVSYEGSPHLGSAVAPPPTPSPGSAGSPARRPGTALRAGTVPGAGTARRVGAMVSGELLGRGRSADVHAFGEGLVLRRYRDGHDATGEADLMARLAGLGYPVPAVHPAAAPARTDLVLERLAGPTMLAALLAGELTAGEAGATLARLLRDLHALPGRIVHLDLHPDNVMLTPDGPVVIDWRNAEEGPPGLDWALSALILAQAAAGPYPEAAGVLAALLPHADAGTAEHLPEARARRAANPTLSAEEVAALDEAVALIGRLGPRSGGSAAQEPQISL
jgi:hypothetical protein